MIEESVISRVLGTALRTGGDFAEVFVEDKRSSSAVLDDGKVEELTSGRDRGAGIRVVVGDTTGFAHTADLTEAGLAAAAEAAAAAARGGGGGTRTVALTRAGRAAPNVVEILPRRRPQGPQGRAAHPGRRGRPLRRAAPSPRCRPATATAAAASWWPTATACWPATTRCARSSRCRAWPPATPACRPAARASATPSASSCSTSTTSTSWPRRAAGRALTKLDARPAPSGADARRHRLAAAVACCSTRRAATGSRPTSWARAPRCSGAGSASRWPAPRVTIVDDGTMAERVGQLRHRRRGPPRPAQRAHRGRRAHRLHVGPAAGPQGGPASSGNGRRQSYQHLPDGAHDQHLPARRHRRPRRDRRLHRPGRLREAPRRRPGQHRHRRLRVRHDRGLPHRERRDHRAAPRGQPHRQRPRGAHPHRRPRQRLRHGPARHLRQGRPGRARSATASRPCG